MESALILVIVFSLLFVVFKLLQKPGCDDDLLLNRIPGPKKLPLIGNLHLLVLSKSPTLHVFRDLAAEYGGLMRLQLGSVPYLIVSSVEVAREVLKTQDQTFANRFHVLGFTKVTYNNLDIVNSPFGAYWRELRKMCSLELLSGRRVKSFQPIREEAISNMAKWIASTPQGSPVNLSEMVCLSSFDITSRASIGKELESEPEEKRRLTSTFNAILRLTSGLCIADLYPGNRLLPIITGMSFKLQRIFRQTDRILNRVIHDHRLRLRAAKAVEDLVDVLLKYQQLQDDHDGAGVHPSLSDDSIKAVILDIFVAGADTSANVVVWAMSEMIRNPTTLKDAQVEVRRVFDGKGYVDEEMFNELRFLKLVIKETMRLHPPLPLAPRMNSERCEINGYEIPAKTRVLVNAWSLGRDPKYWNDPDKFKPERFEDSSHDFEGNNLEFIPFGAGRRTCPGMTFGLATAESSLATLLYHFDWKMPENHQQLDMSEVLGSSLTRKHDLLLIPTLTRPLPILH